MMLCLGATFSRTPMISTLKSSIFVPSKTVRPTPTIPGRTWSRGSVSWARAAETRPSVIRTIGARDSDERIAPS